jgi:chemotaxis protein CheD
MSTLYGFNAMEVLIAECVKLGADRSRLEAKVIGGGHVLRVRETDGNVPQRNVEFALAYLKERNIAVAAQDTGGYAAREIYFFTDSGRLLLKRLSSTGGIGRDTLAGIEREERIAFGRLSKLKKSANDTNMALL